MRWAILAGAAMLAVLALTPVASGKSVILATDDNFFNPRYEPFDLAVAPGEAILVRSTGRDQHTVTSTANAWVAVNLGPGQEGNFTAPSAPGDYRFYCVYHASSAGTPGDGMVGVLRVQGTAGSGAGPTPAKPLPLPSTLAIAAALLALGIPGLAGRGRP